MEVFLVKKYLSKIYYPVCIIFIFAFIVGIFLINLNSENWYNMDIYGDAMYAKYSFEAKSLFPENWIFGNQFYVVATPNVASLIYGICSNAVLSLGVASCIMTLLCVACYIWCLKPFFSKKGIIISLLCFIGAGVIGLSAGGTTKGFQVFFTMGSYYACYLIGILFSLGIYLRLFFIEKVNPVFYALCVLFNFALGIQSLREMLVLNLPLCAISVFLTFFKEKRKWFSKENVFSLVIFLANFLGVIFIELFKDDFSVLQNDILVTDASFFKSLVSLIKAFLEYVGFSDFSQGAIAFVYKNILAVFNISLVGLVIVFSIKKYLKNKKLTAENILILFCVVSLIAVALAGILFIKLRSIYFFVWHILLTISYLFAFNSSKVKAINKTVFLTLIIFSVLSFGFNFGSDYVTYRKTNHIYHEISLTLKNDGITHVLYDDFSLFELAPKISACSDGEIITAPICENFSENGGFYPDLKLCSDEWFDEKNCDSSYLAISEITLKTLEKYGRLDYFNENAQLKYSYKFDGRQLMLYCVSEELYFDLIN